MNTASTDQDNRPTPILWGMSNLIASVFGAGLIRVAPGTAGSLFALFAAVPIKMADPSPLLLGFCTTLMFLIGWVVSSYITRVTTKLDPQFVVVDELVGQWLALLWIPVDFYLYAIAFLFFRILDIAKPWPMSWVQTNIHGGFGVMLDDVLAGLIAGVLTYGCYLGLIEADFWQRVDTSGIVNMLTIVNR